MKSKVELCMICDELPCVCGKPSKPKPQIKVDPVVPVGPSAAQVAIQRQLSAQRRAEHQARFTPPAHRTPSSVNADDASLALALRALEPIMHQESRETYRAILTSVPTLDDRRAAWRSRRERHEA
jgi:hypothetical protein